MKENEFLGWIVDVATRFGWRIWHVPMPVRPIPGGGFVAEKRARGLPDLILLHADPPRLIFAEVKKAGKPLEPSQVEFLRLAGGVARRIMSSYDAAVPQHCPVGVYTWRPGYENLIEAILRREVTVVPGAESDS